jgi:hypothetical protein
MSITLPKLCGSRESAQKLIQTNTDKSPVIDASNVESIAQGYTDELCKLLIEQKIDRVTFINASERLIRDFNRAIFLREAKFLLEYNNY